MLARRLVFFMVLALLVVVALPFAIAWRPAIDAIDPPPRSAFDAKDIARGEVLATLGDCNACHTAPGGKTYAGGRALETPFGVIHGTNITPDPYTGIGHWPEAAFVRAMREGIDREGSHLYPAFPYNHFALLTDEDLRALYAYFMTREPARTETPRNSLSFPFNIRALLAGWNLLFHDRKSWAPDPQQSADWNRGAYLVEGVAHCGACHTPRNLLGAEKKGAHFAGGEIERWHAPALNALAPAPVAWTADRLFAYLRHGQEQAHGAAAGPMAPVVHNLARAPEADVRAIATYVASFALQTPQARREQGDALLARIQEPAAPPQSGSSSGTPQDAGAVIYAAACSMCHDTPRDPNHSGSALNLALSTSVAAPTPRNLINFILYGLAPDEGARGRWMPGFDTAFTDEQLVALLQHLRRQAGNAEAWSDLPQAVKEARRESPEPYAQR